MRSLLAFAIVLILGSPATAAYNLAQLMDNLERKEKSLQGVKFNFVQEVDFTQGGVQSKVEGQAVLGKQGKLQIEKTAPERQITVSNGKKIWVYTPAHRQVWEGRVGDWVHSEIVPKGILPLDGYVKELRANFNLALLPFDQNENIIRFEAKPKEEALGYELEFLISTDTWFPMETIYRSGSAKVITKLSKLEFNPPVSDKTFQFKAPPGTEVIPLKN